jgi:pathogenesis-related protein 1
LIGTRVFRDGGFLYGASSTVRKMEAATRCLLIGTVGYHGVADAVKAWENEKIYYRGQVLNSSNWHACGHYTQVVWRNTKEIGCGKAECGDRAIVVCNYDPPGNVMGQTPF